MNLRYVKHKGKTKDRKCPVCKSWKKHHELHTGEKIDQCSVFRCTNPASEGAHVITSRTKNRREFIILTCSKCNPPYSTEEFRIVKKTPRASAVKCRPKRPKKKATA